RAQAIPRSAACRAAAPPDRGIAQATSGRLGGHVVEPGSHLAADEHLARPGSAASGARLIDVASMAAADVDPFGRAGGKTALDALIDFEIVGQHPGARAIDDVRECHGVLE